jgi:hypothetical protein
VRTRRIAAAIGLGFAILALAYVQLRPAAPPRLSAQEALLSRQNQELLKLASAAESGTLLDFKGVLIVVDQVLVLDLTEALQARVASGRNVYFHDDSHWNAAGHETASEALEARLRARESRP